MLVRFLELDWAEMKSWELQRMRDDLEARPVIKSATRRVRVTDSEAPVPSVWVEPSEGAEERVVLYFHGGSYLFGSHRTHADTLARVALAAKARVLAPDYRRAPEDPYPAQLEDAVAVYEWLLSTGVAPDKIVVAGESAGGNLVVSMLTALRDRGLPLPAGGAPISAWVDLASTRPSIASNAASDYGDLDMLLAQARLFAGKLPLTDPRISPLFAALHGLPPLYVQAGDAERLRDENVELVEKVRAAGGEAELDLVPGHPHAPLFFAQWSPAAQASVDRLGAWIRARS